MHMKDVNLEMSKGSKSTRMPNMTYKTIDQTENNKGSSTSLVPVRKPNKAISNNLSPQQRELNSRAHA